MPIEGDLKSLNLSSVLQLISQQQLTGVLKIKKKYEIIDIGFIEGEVTGAFYEQGEKNERLETYLVRSGTIGKNVYEMIEEIHRETKRPIMNIILGDKYLTMEEIERIIKFKIQEVFDEIFMEEEGHFKFERDAVIYPKSKIKIRMNTERVVLESARRFDEWPRIKSAIPSGDIVYKRIKRPELKLKLADDEARVFSILDGHRSIDDLIEISGLGKFHTYSCLYHLLSIGQIELSYAKPTPKLIRPKRQISLKFLTIPLTVMVMLIILTIEFLIGNYISHHHLLSFTVADEDFYETDYKNYQQIFFYKHGRIPSIEEIEDIFEK